VLTCGAGERGRRSALRVVMGDVAPPRFLRLGVPPLTPSAVERLAADSGLDPGALHRKTAGNPFFLSQVLASGGPGIPASVRDAVLARVARLDSETRAALEAAAVAGERMAPDLLAGLASSSAGDACVAGGMLRG